MTVILPLLMKLGNLCEWVIQPWVEDLCSRASFLFAIISLSVLNQFHSAFDGP